MTGPEARAALGAAINDIAGLLRFSDGMAQSLEGEMFLKLISETARDALAHAEKNLPPPTFTCICCTCGNAARGLSGHAVTGWVCCRTVVRVLSDVVYDQLVTDIEADASETLA